MARGLGIRDRSPNLPYAAIIAARSWAAARYTYTMYALPHSPYACAALEHTQGTVLLLTVAPNFATSLSTVHATHQISERPQSRTHIHGGFDKW